MRSRLSRFYVILFFIITYTSIKSVQLLPAHPYPAVLATLCLFSVMLGGMFIARARAEVTETFLVRILTWTGSLSMGAWATFVLLSLPIDILHLVLYFFIDTSFFSRDSYWGVLAFSVLLAAAGFLQVMRGAKIKAVKVPVGSLHPDLAGLKIAQISDLHVGPTVRRRYVQTVVRRTNEAKPDLVFITGDVADAEATSIAEHLEPLRGLTASLGVFYVTGNHEYYWEAQGLIEKMREFGFVPLMNENRVVKVGGAQILVAGVTDPMGGQMLKNHAPDVKKAFFSTITTQLKVLLAHRPDVCLEAEPIGFDLQLSGHTHGGQFFPFSLFIGLAHTYYRGLNKHGRMWVYVNPGTAYWGPANRFAVPCEISLLTLSAA